MEVSGDVLVQETTIDPVGHLGLVYFVVSKMPRSLFRMVDEEDLVQFGSIGLMYAAKNYRDGFGSFSSYAIPCIRGYIWMGFYKTARLIRVPVRNVPEAFQNWVGRWVRTRSISTMSPHELPWVLPEDPLSGETREAKKVWVQNLLNCLEPRRKQVAQGIMSGRTLTTIGEDMGISLERVRQLRDSAFHKLKCRIKGLANWWDLVEDCGS